MAAAAKGLRERLAGKRPLPHALYLRIQASDPTDAMERTRQALERWLAAARDDPPRALDAFQDYREMAQTLRSRFREVLVRAPTPEELSAAAEAEDSLAGLAVLFATCSLDAQASGEQWWREQLALPLWQQGNVLVEALEALVQLMNQPVMSVYEEGRGRWA